MIKIKRIVSKKIPKHPDLFLFFELFNGLNLPVDAVPSGVRKLALTPFFEILIPLFPPILAEGVVNFNPFFVTLNFGLRYENNFPI